MKLLFAIVEQADAPALIQNLSRRGYQSTRSNTTGGFLNKDNVTIMIGVDDIQVQPVIETIREFTSKRITTVGTQTELGHGQSPSAPLDVSIDGATIFITSVDRYEKV